MDKHLTYMKRAWDLAEKGRGTTLPNPMVGAVLVKNGRIIAEGWHKRCGAAHAEVDALSKIGIQAKGASLYVTLEPCSHTGRTGPCTEAIINAGIKKVFIGTLDPNPLTHQKSIAILRKAGIDVKVGFYEEELTRMNEVFNKYITKKMPFVVAKCAQTLDGKIATATGQSKWITADKTRAYARERRNEFDAIMAGINTILSDDPQLNAARKDKRLIKIVVDSSLQCPLKARLFVGAKKGQVIIATTAKASSAKIKQLQSKGVQVLVAPAKGKHKHVDLKWLFKELAKQEISHLLIEGGGRLIGRALKDGIVDRMMIYIAPKIIGDQNAVSSIAGLNVTAIDRTLELKNIFVQHMAEDFLLEGDVVYRHR
jgi:diaminohydroxyphosphoribosylaminopyrimidine deaminase/5-amino-6-(5-phosphoribosylamino)uracil reductase